LALTRITHSLHSGLGKLVFAATFKNTSVLSQLSVLLMGETCCNLLTNFITYGLYQVHLPMSRSEKCTFQSYHYFSEITGPIETELGKNVRWMVLYKVYAFCSDWKFNLVAMVINVLLMAKKN
jgi:hypothetical protein